jgi:hypothetical protein
VVPGVALEWQWALRDRGGMEYICLLKGLDLEIMILNFYLGNGAWCFAFSHINQARCVVAMLVHND